MKNQPNKDLQKKEKPFLVENYTNIYNANLQDQLNMRDINQHYLKQYVSVPQPVTHNTTHEKSMAAYTKKSEENMLKKGMSGIPTSNRYLERNSSQNSQKGPTLR